MQPNDKLPGRDSRLSNAKPRCGVSALHFFCEIDNTNGFLTIDIDLIQISASSSFLSQH
jgi:hypothetical protein